MKYFTLMIGFLCLLSTFIMAYPDTDPNLQFLPPDLRELNSASNAYQGHYFKSLNYLVQLLSPGYIRRSISNIRQYDPETGLHTVIGKSSRKWLDGRPVETHRQLDFIIRAQNKGFFVIQTPQFIAYTKDGRFRIDHENRLVTLSNNYPVLGVDGFIYLNYPLDVTVARNGTIYNGAQRVGKLQIAVFRYFTDMNTLESMDGKVFILPEPVELLVGDDHYQVMNNFMQQANPYKSHDSYFYKAMYKSTHISLQSVIKSQRRIFNATN